MNNALVQFKIKQRLNKKDSNDYPNLDCAQMVEAFNKFQLEFCKDKIKAGENNKDIVDDIQPIIKTKLLNGSNTSDYFETEELPKDYLAFSRCDIIAVRDLCEVGDISVDLVEQGNLSDYLRNYTTSPSFEWRETFCTLKENKVRIYTSGDFTITKCMLTYYRYPVDISFNNCEDEHGNITPDVECEFKKDVVERIISGACQIIAGDIENINQIQINNKP